jgi:hypothetical protein
MIDTTSWGVLIEKTSEEAWELISKIAANSQQFGVHVDSFRRFNEVIHSNWHDQKIDVFSQVQERRSNK